MSGDDKDLTPPEGQGQPETPGQERQQPEDAAEKGSQGGWSQPETPPDASSGDAAPPADGDAASQGSADAGQDEAADADAGQTAGEERPKPADETDAAASHKDADEPDGEAPPSASEEAAAAADTAADTSAEPGSGSPDAQQAAGAGGGQPPQVPGQAGPPASAADEPGGEDDEDDEEDEDEPEQMTFMEHLQELRIRLTRIAIAVGIGFLACYGFSKQLFEFLMRPLVAVFPPDSKLIFTALPEAFFTYIKVAMVAGVLLTSPYIFYQIWRFVAPGLYDEERKHLVPIAFVSGLFFAAGATFGYSVVFPFAFEFFMDFATETIRPMPSLKEYLSFSLKLLFAFGVIFELPLFIFFLSRLGIVNAAMLRKFRKYAYLCSFIVSAVLTPPDVVSQTLMAGPLIVLYELSIWVSQVFGKKRPKPEEDEDEAAEDEETGEQTDDSKPA